ncbi:RloB family protein [Rhodovarius sp.]|uniref:RloB family protein n=1 Tax=Rhodovarius sp. TaxID=2972673 RepID=UPI0034A0FC7F
MSGEARSSRSLSRRGPFLKSQNRALVVCEGEKTEPTYLRDLISDLGLSTADVRICGKECGSDPKSIYKYARAAFQQDGDYDTVFCVFDRDEHATFEWACKAISTTKLPNSKKMICIKSIPCFEYWLILHFNLSTAPINRSKGKSSGELAVAELKRLLPSYEKGAEGVFKLTRQCLPLAIQRSKTVENEAAKNGSENPITLMHILVEHLTKMAETRL